MQTTFCLTLIGCMLFVAKAKEVAFDLYLKTCAHAKAGTKNHVSIRLRDADGRVCTAYKINKKNIDFHLLHLFENVKCKASKDFRIEKLKTLDFGQDWASRKVWKTFCVTRVKIVPQKGVLKGVEIKTISPMKLWVGFSFKRITSAFDINNCAPNPCKNSIACQEVESNPQSDSVYCYCARGWYGKYCNKVRGFHDRFCDCEYYSDRGCIISKAPSCGYKCICKEFGGKCLPSVEYNILEWPFCKKEGINKVTARGYFPVSSIKK